MERGESIAVSKREMREANGNETRETEMYCQEKRMDEVGEGKVMEDKKKRKKVFN